MWVIFQTVCQMQAGRKWLQNQCLFWCYQSDHLLESVGFLQRAPNTGRLLPYLAPHPTGSQLLLTVLYCFLCSSQLWKLGPLLVRLTQILQVSDLLYVVSAQVIIWPVVPANNGTLVVTFTNTCSWDSSPCPLRWHQHECARAIF